jgi:hypothetical protein
VEAVWAGEGVTVAAGLRALDTLPGGARAATLAALDAILVGDAP